MENLHDTTDITTAPELPVDTTTITPAPEATPETQPAAPDVNKTHKMSPNVTSLTARQRVAVMLLAGGRMLKDVAKELKVRRETVSRWQKLPLFQEAFEQAIEENKRKHIKKREEMRENLRHEVTHMMNEAIDTIKSQFRNWHGSESSDRAQLALNVLKLLKTDQIFSHAAALPASEKP